MIDNYVTGTQIRTLRENKKQTQEQLAAAIADNGIQFEKLYPEGPAQARFKISRVRR